MRQQPVHPFECIAGTSVAFLARVRDINGELITRSSVHDIDVVAQNQAGTKTLDTDLAVANTVFDALQTDDPRWEDNANQPDADKGFNFCYVAPAATFPAAGHYRVEFTFTDVDGCVTKMVFEGAARSSLN